MTIGGIPMSNTGTPTRNTTPVDESATPSAGNARQQRRCGDPTSLVTDDHEASAGNDERAGPFLSLHPFSCPAGTAPTDRDAQGDRYLPFPCPNSNPELPRSVATSTSRTLQGSLRRRHSQGDEGNAQSGPGLRRRLAERQRQGRRRCVPFLRGKDLAGQPLTGAVQAQWFFSQIQAAGGLDDGDLPR